MMTTGILGSRAEKLAAKFLTSKGIKIVDRNYRCKLGEIDLIARDNEDIIFVEVRYRKSIAFGSPLDSVDARKQNKLKNAAQHYLLNKGLYHHSARFDVVGLTGSLSAPDVQWIRNAIA